MTDQPNIEAPAIADQPDTLTPAATTEEVTVAVVETEAPVAEAPAVAETPAAEAPVAPTPASAASTAPSPRPVPRPGAPRPGAPRPGAVKKAAAPSVPVVPVLDAVEAAEAARWGRVDDESTVWVREAAGERAVGQYPDAEATEALAYFVRKFLELQSQVTLFEARLEATDLSTKEIDSTLAKLTEALAEPNVVGDLDGLRARLEALRAVAAERRAAAEAANRAAKAKALEERTAIVEKAEALVATDPERIHWRQAGDQLRVLLAEWKTAQSSGPRIDRPAEEALWKRFSHARTTFDRNRRHFFAALEESNSAAKAAKEKLILDAEKLSKSTDWGPTAGEFRALMDRWKAAGHAGRADDDKLWARFRAAQDTFFNARSEANEKIDEEYGANLAVKLEILTEVEALLPIKDLNATKAKMRTLQDRWDAVGRVPRANMHDVEARMRAVEQAIRTADEDNWKRSNPETKARVEGASSQLEQAIAALEADLAKAQASGNARKISEVEQALAARKSWLEQIQRSAGELS